MTKKATTKLLHLEYVGASQHRPATHVLLNLTTGRVTVAVGVPVAVPIDSVAAYHAAPLPPGYAWKGRSSGRALDDQDVTTTASADDGAQEKDANG